MVKTIIFISGFMVPKFIGKSSLVWDDSFWQEQGYRRIYLSSAIPTSDRMVERELDKLSKFINRFPDVTVAGQSLGGWWAANLGCMPECKIKKLCLWTPLLDPMEYPFFNVTPLHLPTNKIPNSHNCGPHKTLVMSAKDDWIVPHREHAWPLVNLFRGTDYHLYGGHYYQKNHKAGLDFLKEWIELG